MRSFRTTLRTRLTLWYVFLLSIVLLLYAGWTSIVLWQNLVRELDSSLRRDLETVENLIVVTQDGHIRVDMETGGQDSILLLEVWSEEGTLLYQSKELKGQLLGSPVTKDDPSH